MDAKQQKPKVFRNRPEQLLVMLSPEEKELLWAILSKTGQTRAEFVREKIAETAKTVLAKGS